MGVIAIVGPTAAAKSSIAMGLAQRIRGEIVSVDSMQVYRGLDIGTAKPSAADRAAVPHHVVDVVEPEDSFTVADHQRLGVAALDAIAGRGSQPLVVGGSGLHFRALVDPLEFPPSDARVRAELEAMDSTDAVTSLLAIDPGAAATIDLANPRRVVRALEIHRLTGLTPTRRAATHEAAAVRDYRSRVPLLAIGLDPGDRLPDRVTHRFDEMIEDGLLQEVTALQHRLGITAAQAVGYKQLLPVVRGEATLPAGRHAAVQATTALAKRQRTFFRRDPRIRWIPWHDDVDDMLEEIVALVTRTVEEESWIS